MRALLMGIVPLLCAGTLAAQQHHHAGQTQAGQRPSTPQCPHAGAMPQGHMMPGMMSQHMNPGGARMDEIGTSAMMDRALMDVMHQTMVFSPERVLQEGDALNLSARQREQLDDLVKGRGTAIPGTGHEDLRTLLGAESADLAAVRAAAERAFAQDAAASVDRVVAAVAARLILTPE